MRALHGAVVVASVTLVLSAGVAVAGDGVFEINQACAAGPGCFPGDDPGYPVRITDSGAFQLTSDLEVPEVVNGIVTLISGEYAGGVRPERLNISIDLNGFVISSTTICTPTPSFECAPASTTSGVGILFTASEGGSAIIHNGTVRGMAYRGIWCEWNCLVRDVVVAHNGHNGLNFNGSASGVFAYLNGDDGISLLAIDSVGTVIGCTATKNGDAGIRGAGSIVNNSVRDNVNFGIFAAGSSTVVGNRVTMPVEGGVGVSCSYCALHDNAIGSAGGVGIDFNSAQSIFGGNLINGSSLDDALVNDASAVQDGVNLCNGSVCP